MDRMPTTKALFGYDVIGSSSTDDDLLDEVRQQAADLVQAAFEHTGVETGERANYSATGDGSLAVFPEQSLPALIDAAHHLQGTLYLHNRRFRPDIRLRLSVHTAPVRLVDSDHFQRPTIDLARLLDATVFKQIVRRMGAYRPVTVAIVVSDQAYRSAVRGGHTQRLKMHDFAEIEVANKEFTDRCWVWAPGLDTARIRELALSEPAEPTARATEPEVGPAAPAATNQTFSGGFQGNNIAGNNSGHTTANYNHHGVRP